MSPASPVPPLTTDPLFESVFASMAEGVIVYDAAGRAVLANERACALLGLTAAQIRGEAPVDHHWLAMRPDGSKLPFSELPVTRVRLTGEEVVDALMGIQRADRTIWLSGNAVAVTLPDGDRGVISTFRDATEVKVGREVDRALRELATQLVDAPAGTPFMDEFLATLGRVAEAERVLYIGIDRRLGRARTSHQWSRTGELFEPLKDGVPLDLMPRLLGGLARRELVTLVDRADLPGDAPSIVASQLIAWGLEAAVAAPVIGGDALLGFITIGWAQPSVPHPRLLDFVVVAAELLSSRTERERAHDELKQLNASLDDRVRSRSVDLLRERAQLAKANDDLQRALQAKTDFLARISHELRTPMTAVLGHTEMLLDESAGALTAAQRESLSTIDGSGKHLLALINDLLDLAHMESDANALNLETVDAGEVARLAVELVRHAAEPRDVRVESEVPTDAISLRADRRRLTQILVNLLDNAVKFTEDGGIVALRLTGPEQGEVRFAVSDTGIGIAPEDQARVFEPFTQVDGGPARRYTGSGLGLALAKQLATLHGGRIDVVSEVGVGSMFLVVLPVDGPGS